MTPSNSPDAQKWRNKNTGTVYASIAFERGGLATVTTDAGSTYLVKQSNLEKLTPPTDAQGEDELFDSEFNLKFKELKQLRNSHQIDEPEFDDRVEQLAVDTYGHSGSGQDWCCACDADKAFMEAELTKREKRAYKQGWDSARGEALDLRENIKAAEQALLDELIKDFEGLKVEHYNVTIDLDLVIEKLAHRKAPTEEDKKNKEK